MTNIKNIKKLSEQELKSGLKTSWHDQYKDSAWIFVGGLPYDLSEGDVLCIFSQYGEIVNINLVRDKISGKSKGFCFICYEDQRSTVLSVDNLNGIKVLGRTIRVDHVNDYKPPKDNKYTDEETKRLQAVGCAPGTEFGSIFPVKTEDIKQEKDATEMKRKLKKEEFVSTLPVKTEDIKQEKDTSRKKKKSEKKIKKKKKKRKKSSSSSSSSSSSESE